MDEKIPTTLQVYSLQESCRGPNVIWRYLQSVILIIMCRDTRSYKTGEVSEDRVTLQTLTFSTRIRDQVLLRDEPLRGRCGRQGSDRKGVAGKTGEEGVWESLTDVGTSFGQTNVSFQRGPSRLGKSH